MRLFGAWLALAAALAPSAAPAAPPRPVRTVAVTFDDLPVQGFEKATPAETLEINRRLLATLEERRIPAVGFVNESKLTADGRSDPLLLDALAAWVGAGRELGNHTWSHADLHHVSVAAFEDEITKGEAVTRRLLEEHGSTLTWFRYPYLHTGRDLETRRAVGEFLASHGYRNAPVTIDSGEWIYARAYSAAAGRRDARLVRRLVKDYVRYMEEKTDYFERESVELFGREIPQVLLVHANRLNADHFGAIVRMLARRGYRFVTLFAALADPAYASPDTFTGAGGISWIHRWVLTARGAAGVLPGEPAVPDFVMREAGVDSE